jgi:dTDP-4-amino-4,6-dideoxygalactose transaminase
MWARKRLDVGWLDLAYGALRCLVGGDRAATQERIEKSWSPSGDAMACLSVRTGFDLLLTALDFPPGSEILISALTIRDMVRIVEKHGLVSVPVDLDLVGMAPDVEGLKRAITPKTRAVLVAHLFGGRIRLEPILEIAKKHSLVVIEDCAQAYAGATYTGHAEVDAAMFSFGPIKTATALQGALLRVRDADVLARMRAAHAGYPVQGKPAFMLRVLKYSLLKALSWRRVFGGFVRICRFFGRDYDRVVNGAVRGFAGAGFFARIRKQPSAPLLALLERRVKSFGAETVKARAEMGRKLAEMLSKQVRCPGVASLPHHFWVFPIMTADPLRTISALRDEGFDATQGQSLAVVEPPRERPQLDPRRARLAISKIVYLPCYAEMPPDALARMAEVVNATASPVEEAEAPETDLSRSWRSVDAGQNGAGVLKAELR